MIAIISGNVIEKLDDLVVVDAGGVGYGLLVPQEDWARLSIGQSAKLYVYEHIREQAHDLYGFINLGTKKLFEILLGVNGVGPKMALSLLSIGSADDVKSAIAEGNIKFLSVASGVGKKVAERIVVDLKDKVGFSANPDATTFLTSPTMNRYDEAQEALVALGYSAQDAANALSGIDSSLSVEDRIKAALSGGK